MPPMPPAPSGSGEPAQPDTSRGTAMSGGVGPLTLRYDRPVILAPKFVEATRYMLGMPFRLGNGKACGGDVARAVGDDRA